MRGLMIVAIAVLLFSGAVGAEEGIPRSFSREFPIETGSDLEVFLKVGEMEVETAPVDKVRVEVTASCRPQSDAKCSKRLEAIELESVTGESGTSVSIRGVSKRYSNMDVDAKFTVPETSALSVRMYAGEVRVEGAGQDLDVRLKFGDVTVRQPLEKTRSVLADANIGDAEVFASSGQTDPSRPFLVGSRVFWEDGEGEADVAVNLGAGSVTVHLD